jgi:hypothetical protein
MPCDFGLSAPRDFGFSADEAALPESIIRVGESDESTSPESIKRVGESVASAFDGSIIRVGEKEPPSDTPHEGQEAASAGNFALQAGQKLFGDIGRGF